MKKLYITVDVECHDISLINNYIWGKVGDKEYGLRCILEQSKKHDIPINFFVDLCEAKRYGNAYAEEIVEAIQEYSQPIYLHLHPNYISGNDDKSFLWQYSYEEQREILKEGFAQYREIMKTSSCNVFRVGRYAASPQMYDALNELGETVIDLSYGYKNGKMCHVSYEDVKTVNKPVAYKNQTVLPNTRFICLDFFGKQKTLNTDIQEARLSELKRVIRESDGEDIVLTMHSWHFINRYFYKKSISGNKKAIKKFDKLITFCKKNGYQFCAVDEASIPSRIVEKQDESQVVNCSKGFWGKIKAFFCNFFRFQEMGKVNKKYFIIYSLFYGALTLGLLLGGGLLLWALL